MKQFRLLIALTVMIPNTLFSQVFTIPYFEDFETGAPGWVATTSSPSNWELGTPSYGNNNSAYSGNSCWDIDLDGGYADATNCFLDAPPFNFSGHNALKISLWVNYDTEMFADGMVILFRTDTTIPLWSLLGSVNASGSINWYNSFQVQSLGNFPGWSGNSGGWENASLVIPNIFGNSTVWFRFRFASDPSVSYDGFSIDDFSIEPDDASFISGRLYLDVNNNSLIDSSDTPFTGIKVWHNNNNSLSYVMPDSNGYYLLYSDTIGSSVVSTDPVLYHSQVPSDHNITLNSIGQISAGNDFLYMPFPGIIDVWTHQHDTYFRPGLNSYHHIAYGNIGTDTVSGDILFAYDSQLSPVSSSIPYTQISPNVISFNYTDLLPGESRILEIVTITDGAALVGDSILNSVLIYPLTGDANSFNNVDTVLSFVVNSYDPNNKLVDPDKNITLAQVAAGIDLNYTINFQNTGNAPAIHVNVLDVIDDLLDLSTFQIVSTSHPLTSVDIAANRQIHFQFANINLPDSVNNEPASHGFISYRIRPLTSLFEGDEISNTAAIYFDNNLPLITNTVITKVETPVGVSDVAADGQIVLYPNPNHGNFTVQFHSSLSFDSWVVYNTLGGKVDSGKVTQQDSFGIRSSSLTPGIYLIRLSGKQDSRTLRFVVH